MSDMGTLGITGLRDAISSDRITAVDATRHYLERIEASQPVLSAYTSVDVDGALAQARIIDGKAASGEPLGLLAGTPVSVKDIIDVKGIATTSCSHSALTKVPGCDAAVVARLRASDAIIIGKANCHEFAFGGPSFDLPFPPARNSWNPEYFPGGSSSGSGVSVAAGLCLASIATDTAGSIRLPSGNCGVVGLMPGYDRVPRHGVRPLSITMDHVGPIARNVRECRIVYECLAGPAGNESGIDKRFGTGAFATLRFGMAVAEWGLEDRLHPDVLAAYNHAGLLVKEGGGLVEQVRLPSLELVHAAATITMMAEIAANHASIIRENYNDYGTVFRSRTLVAETLRLEDYMAAISLRDELYRETIKLFDQVEVIALPVSVNPPGKLTAVDRFYFMGDSNINILANFLHLPAITLPCGLSKEGLPIGMQILGRRGSEASLLDIAEGLEKRIGSWDAAITDKII